jgi:hypothetical protein
MVTRTKLATFMLLMTLAISCPSKAQVTIGSGIEPEGGVLLDLKQKIPSADNTTAIKGLLLPRVILSDLNRLYPMYETTPGSGVPNSDYDDATEKAGLDARHTGLTVYNLNKCFSGASGKGGPGVYTWSGTEWQYLGIPKDVLPTYPVSENLSLSNPDPSIIPSSLSERTYYVPYNGDSSIPQLTFKAPSLDPGTVYEWFVNGVSLTNPDGNTSNIISYTPPTTDRYVISVNAHNWCVTPPLDPITIIVGCGAFIASGEWRVFMCHNLGAVDSADPFTPDKKLFGDYYQWGQNTIAAFGPNDATNPDGLNGTWENSSALDGAWTDGSKAADDPCPTGFRVPTRAEWLGVFNNSLNPQTSVGNYVGATNPNASTTYDCGIRLGDCLYLPATGYRTYDLGNLRYRGHQGEYWTTTHLEDHFHAYGVRFGNKYSDGPGDDSYLITTGTEAPADGTNRTRGYQVRCIAE